MTTLAQVTPNTSGNEVTVNQIVTALSAAGLFGLKSNVALTFGYYGGQISVAGVLTTIGDGTLTLTNAATNYVEVDSSGTLSFNTTGFTAGRTPLYTIVTAGSVMTSITDCRVLLPVGTRRLSKSIAGGAATVTLTAAEATNRIIELTGAITGAQSIVVPNSTEPLTIYNGTSGAFSVTIKTASGTGIVVATGKRAIVYADGTNVVRVSADI